MDTAGQPWTELQPSADGGRSRRSTLAGTVVPAEAVVRLRGDHGPGIAGRGTLVMMASVGPLAFAVLAVSERALRTI